MFLFSAFGLSRSLKRGIRSAEKCNVRNHAEVRNILENRGNQVKNGGCQDHASFLVPQAVLSFGSVIIPFSPPAPNLELVRGAWVCFSGGGGGGIFPIIQCKGEDNPGEKAGSPQTARG